MINVRRNKNEVLYIDYLCIIVLSFPTDSSMYSYENNLISSFDNLLLVKEVNIYLKTHRSCMHSSIPIKFEYT